MKQGDKSNIKENKAYYLTMTVVGWIDIFSRDVYREILVSSLRHCIAEKGLNIYAFVIMTNHLHLIVNSNEPFELSSTILDLKKFTSKAIVNQIIAGPESRREWMLKLFSVFALDSSRHKEYMFWIPGNHAIELYNSKFTRTKINYIHDNPVRAGFVRRQEDWIYSSISNYMDLESKIPEILRVSPLLNFNSYV